MEAKRADEKSVSVISELRKLYAWFELDAKHAVRTALRMRRKKLKAPKVVKEEHQIAAVEELKRRLRIRPDAALSDTQSAAVLDRIEEIQAKINPLESEQHQLIEVILGHIARVGRQNFFQRAIDADESSFELSHPKGMTLITFSYQYELENQVGIKAGLDRVDPQIWAFVRSEAVDPLKLLAVGDGDRRVRRVIRQFPTASVRISLVPPSSRTPKSGNAQPGATEQVAA